MDSGRRKESNRACFTAFCAAAHSFSTVDGDPKMDDTNLLLASRPNDFGGVASEGLFMDGLFSDRRAESGMTRARETVASRRRWIDDSRGRAWNRASRVADARLTDAHSRRTRSRRSRARSRRVRYRGGARARV